MQLVPRLVAERIDNLGIFQLLGLFLGIGAPDARHVTLDVFEARDEFLAQREQFQPGLRVVTHPRCLRPIRSTGAVIDQG
jgi:hypothetical protein